MQPATAQATEQAAAQDVAHTDPDEDPHLALARLMVRAGARARVGDDAAAAALYGQALALDPGHAPALLHWTNALMRLQQPEAALASVREALALLPDDHALHYTRGMALHQAQRFDEALAAYDRALALGAPPQQVQFAQAATHLMRGDYAAGWPLYEMREAREAVLAPWRARGLAEPPPEALTGGPAGLLLVAEQGYGDIIQFSRFALDLAARGVPVWLTCPPPLQTLLARLPGVRGVLAPGASPGDAGWPPGLRWVLPVASLPLHLGLRSNAEVRSAGVQSSAAWHAPMPHAPGYLRADPRRVALWSERLGPRALTRDGLRPRPRVGLAWSGGEHRAADWGRSIPLAQLLLWLPEGIDYVHLQPDLRESDRPALEAAPHIRHFGEAIRDFDDSAALCTLVDEVVTVCTSAAHLAGALGRPTRVLLRATPCWRWGLGREDSDWYGSVRLMRQSARECPSPQAAWQPVLRALGAALARLTAPPR